MTQDNEPTEVLKYRGLGRNGAAIVGRGRHGESAAALAERFFYRGFQRLTIEGEDGREAGGISRVGRQRTWWGERVQHDESALTERDAEIERLTLDLARYGGSND